LRDVIELTDVRKAFHQGSPNEFWAIRGVTLTISAGAVTVFRGPSGSGKTTLASLIGCLARPTAGRVRVNGQVVSALPERFLTEVRRSTFGFVFQQPSLIPALTTIENVMLPSFPLGLPYGALRRRARELLAELGLADRANARVEWLSGGEAQRAATARALMNDPEALIADEPTANLDSERTREFMAIVGRLKGQGRTVILTSHDPLVYEADVVDRVIQLRDGQVDDDV
jgi:putative ABC transport system ATP-binding protein